MVSLSHSLLRVSAVCVLVLLVVDNTTGYYDRSRRYVSFSRRAYELGGGASSSTFFSLGGWSGGGSSNSDDSGATRNNVRVSYYNNHDDSDVEGEPLPVGDGEDD